MLHPFKTGNKIIFSYLHSIMIISSFHTKNLPSYLINLFNNNPPQLNNSLPLTTKELSHTFTFSLPFRNPIHQFPLHPNNFLLPSQRKNCLKLLRLLNCLTPSKLNINCLLSSYLSDFLIPSLVKNCLIPSFTTK